MNNTTQYCIVYAVICMETSERLSVGVLAFGDGECCFRYSQKKLDALERLLPKKVFDFYCNIIKNLDPKELSQESSLEYMRRYANNLLAISEVKKVDMQYNKNTTDWLYNSYIDIPMVA